MLVSDIPFDVPRAEGAIVATTQGGSALSIPTTLAFLDGAWRLYVYPFDRTKPLDPAGAEQHLKYRDAVPHTAPGRDGWIVLQNNTPDDALGGIRDAGYPVHRTTDEEVRRQAAIWVDARIEYDAAIGRGEVDW